MASIREREHEDAQDQRSVKRAKVDDRNSMELDDTTTLIEDSAGLKNNILPPSHSLLGIPQPSSDGFMLRILERDVGISEYVGRDVPSINGIIKQRFTDFLVHEVDLDGLVVHVKSLAMPTSEKLPHVSESLSAKVGDDDHGLQNDTGDAGGEALHQVNAQTSPGGNSSDRISLDSEPWPDVFTTTLAKFLSDRVVEEIKSMYLEGREPPRVSDTGWAARSANPMEGSSAVVVGSTDTSSNRAPHGARKGKRRGRGGRVETGHGREDHRKVLSDPIASKTTRTALHQTIRELFGGKLDSETDNSCPVSEEGARVTIRWSQRGTGRGGRSDRGGRTPRGTFPPYIHFTVQKANRDTQDVLGYLSRILHVNVRDLAVAGTKDKRGVTVQRVSLKRAGKTVEDVWKLANGQGPRKTVDDILSQRGEHGIRIADLNYRKAGLQLGMLKGNSFLITLRNVQIVSEQALDDAMTSLKHKGFINYYGMQRFGTASIPTHAIGLALLRSDWHEAVSLILQPRAGEHPDMAAAREAWLVDKDLDKALELMPRRAVAERCILESYKKQRGETRNAMGALSTIPKNLRLMYVHAYQSYVWNAIVSERIRICGSDNPVPGDLVYDLTRSEDADPTQDISDIELDFEEKNNSGGGEQTQADLPSRKQWALPRVKTLTLDDVDKYTIFDVIMPLPGKDVAYPAGTFGEKYCDFLRLDGLDPDNFVRKQKEYSLTGSYRAIIHRPKDLHWSTVRYTDPDVPLAQSDEDKLLGFDPPALVEEGKFAALQINMILGTAAYATMALREITKTETGSHFQSNLTAASEDQKFRQMVE